MSEAAFVTEGAKVRQSRRGLAKLLARVMLALVVGPVVLALLGGLIVRAGVVLPAGIEDLTWAVWVPAWLIGVPITGVAAAVAGMRYPMGRMAVDADRSGLRLTGPTGSVVAVRDEIESALVVDGAEPEVEIALAGGHVLLVALPRMSQARGMVEALGFGAADRWISVPLGTAREPLTAGCSAAVLAAFVSSSATCAVAAFASHGGSSDAISAMMGVLFVVGTVALARHFTPGRLVVGTDGLLVEKGFRKKLIPRAAIVDVISMAGGLGVVYESGGRVHTMTLAPDRGARRAALAARIRAMIGAPAPGTGAATSGLLARGGRTVDAWQEALRKLARARSYRDEVVSADVLLQTAEAPDAPAEQRIGAAMVIGFGEDAGVKQRLRVAVEGIADAGLRAAMERAAEGEAEAEAIEAALEAARRAETR
jgi:hypothetical protein